MCQKGIRLCTTFNVRQNLADSLRTSSPDELYEETLARYGPALERLAVVYEADRERRRDLVQDIHFALWRSFHHFAQRCSLRTWVYQVAHHIATSHVVRQRRTYAGLISLEEIEVPVVGDTDSAIDRRTALTRLVELMQRLKPMDRQVILSYLEGMDAESISEITGISAANVATKVHRIKRILFRRFQTGGPHGR
jgi:RNA polymerase sigma-70 factor, ECF subfamily